MKPSNVSLLKLSRVSSRILMRKSVKAERRCFVTILNPSAPKIKRLQRNPGLETQTPSVESEKISLLKKALGELNLEIPPLASQESSTEEVLVQSSTTNVTPASEEEIEPGSVIENAEKILTDDLPTTPVAPNTSQRETDDNINILQVGIEEAAAQDSRAELRAELKSEEKSLTEGRNKLLTKKAKKSAAKTTTAQTADSKDEGDSSSSDSDSSSSSSSSSESEDEEKKPVERTRLDQESLLDLTKLSSVKPVTKLLARINWR